MSAIPSDSLLEKYDRASQLFNSVLVANGIIE